MSETHVCLQRDSTDEFLLQFGLRLAQLIAPDTHVQTVQQAVKQTILEATALADNTGNVSQQRAAQPRQLELVFVHDCK